MKEGSWWLFWGYRAKILSSPVYGNPTLKPELRIKWQSSNARTPTPYPSLHPSASYPRAIDFSHLFHTNCFYSSSLPHTQIPPFPINPSSQYMSFCQPMALLCFPTSVSHTCPLTFCICPPWQTKSPPTHTDMHVRIWGNLDVSCTYQKSSGK